MSAWLMMFSVLLSAEPGAREIDFGTEIMPIFTRSGCNAGACHGAAAGRGGFRLSLLGSDPAADYAAIVHEFEGRRINLARPAASLLLKKGTGNLEHGGDAALDEDGNAAKNLISWINAGAKFGPGRQLVEFQITPTTAKAERIPAEIALQATATFDDDRKVDVTTLTVFTLVDPLAVEIRSDPQAAVKVLVKRRAPQVILARFLDRIVPVQIVIPFRDEFVDLSTEHRTNFIDEEIYRTLLELRIPVSPRASDEAYLRRVRRDLTGRLPDVDERNQFVEDLASDKRQRLVDRLLASPEFADYWTLRFARQLRLHSLPNEKIIAKTYAEWIRKQLVQGTPLNVWAKELLVATGDSHEIGPANFSRMVLDAREQAELVGEFFLGARLGCANCHNHPLDRWTQDDYHGLAAVFAKFERGRYVKLTPRGEVTNLRTGEPAVPRIPGQRDLSNTSDPLRESADWLTSAENQLFAKATVNRLWQAMFGRGLVEPVDDLRETNPATHPELLDRLAADFVSHRYDIRHTLRLIALSETYGRSADTNLSNMKDDRYYSHALRRPLGPEVLADAIADVTGVANEFTNEKPGTRAVQIVDPLTPAPSLDILGRCSRAAGCNDRAIGGLPAQLHLLNGELLNAKLTNKNGRLHQLLAAKAPPDDIVSEFFLRALGREPTDDEVTRWLERVKSNDHQEYAQRCEDFLWALLNSREFAENR